jgi:hypothetical protein
LPQSFLLQSYWVTSRNREALNEKRKKKPLFQERKLATQ